eukprot:112950_1
MAMESWYLRNGCIALHDGLLCRQFHTAHFEASSQQLVVFGGYGTPFNRKKKKSESSKLPRARLNDVMCFKYDSNHHKLVYDMHVDPSQSIHIPKHRQHHSMVTVQNKMNESFLLMFGGRSNPRKAFNDCWLYHIAQHQWMPLNIQNKHVELLSRYRHSMCAISDDKVVLFGGVTVQNNQQKLLNDMCILTVHFESLSVEIQRIEYAADMNAPVARCSMTVQWIRDGIKDKLLVFGGLTNLNCYSEDMVNDPNVYLFDLSTQRWNVLQTLNDGPLGLYGHADCVTTNRDTVFMSGGVLMERNALLNSWDMKYNDMLWKLQLNTRLWHRYKINETQMNIGHKVISHAHDVLWLVGGGVHVFSFGSVYSTSIVTLHLAKHSAVETTIH